MMVVIVFTFVLRGLVVFSVGVVGIIVVVVVVFGGVDRLKSENGDEVHRRSLVEGYEPD